MSADSLRDMATKKQRSRLDLVSSLQPLQMVVFLIIVYATWSSARAQDIFRTDKSVPRTSATSLLGSIPCLFGPLSKPLSLQEAVERALCNNPKTRQAWANVRVQAAAVGIVRAGYLPTVTGTWQEAYEATTTKIDGSPQYDTGDHLAAGTGSISFSLILFDFGGRRASLRNANALLVAAQASLDSTLQDTFASVAQHYYAAQAAEGNWKTAEDNKITAEASLQASRQRVEKGVAAVSDSLQSQTAYYQAVLNQNKAKGDRLTTLGTLAADIAVRPDVAIQLTLLDENVASEDDLDRAASTLIDEALEKHPSVRAAGANLKAAEAKVAEVRAGGLPVFTWLAKASRTQQPATFGVGLPPYLATINDAYVGFQISMPVFEGFAREYQIRQASAQVLVERETFNETKKQVALDVWTTYQTEKTATENLSDSAALLSVAQLSYDASHQRYLAGVGTVMELLNTQSSLATARQQRVQALTDWRISRLSLASKLGNIGMWRIAGQ